MTDFKIYDLNADLDDPFTTPKVWENYFQRAAVVSKAYGDGMRKVEEEMNKIINNFTNEKIINYSHTKMEREYAGYRSWNKLMADNAYHNAELFEKLQNSMKGLTNAPKELILINAEKTFKEAKKAFDERYKKTEQLREAYHKKAFEAEKTEIKKGLAEKEAEIKKYTEKLDSLKEKVNEKYQKYKKEFIKLMEAETVLQEESYKYTAARLNFDSTRAVVILETLQMYNTEARVPEDAETIDFDGVRVGEVIKSRMPQSSIVVKKPERYKGTKNKDALFRQMKEELQEERKQKKKSRPVKDDIVPGSGDAEPGPSHSFEVGRKYLVVKAFEKTESNQISLTQGKFIKLVMPPNEKGLAIGEKTVGFRRKKKGYFPVSHVIPAD